MAARVSQVIIEAIFPTIAYSPTDPTGAGVTQVIVEAVWLRSACRAKVSQIVVEAIIADDADGSHGDPGGCEDGGGGSPVTRAYTWAT